MWTKSYRYRGRQAALHGVGKSATINLYLHGRDVTQPGCPDSFPPCCLDLEPQKNRRVGLPLFPHLFLGEGDNPLPSIQGFRIAHPGSETPPSLRNETAAFDTLCEPPTYRHCISCLNLRLCLRSLYRCDRPPTPAWRVIYEAILNYTVDGLDILHRGCRTPERLALSLVLVWTKQPSRRGS